MPTDLGAHTWLLLVNDAGTTPPELAPYAGRLVGLTADQVAAFPSDGRFDVIIIDGVQIPGYYVLQTGQHEWVMQPPQDPTKAAIDVIPGPEGWADPNALQTYYQIGQALRNLGVPGQDLRWGLKALYDQAIANDRAKTAQGQS